VRSTAENLETAIILFNGLRDSEAVTEPLVVGLPTAIQRSVPVEDLAAHWDLIRDQVRPRPETEVTDA
jgi:hypothetical protein